jgi:hypothetical protein
MNQATLSYGTGHVADAWPFGRSWLQTLWAVLLLPLLLTACGGGGGAGSGGLAPTGPTPQKPTYSVGGTIAGLVGSHLVLVYSGDNGGAASLILDANGAFAFLAKDTGAVTGTRYNVTVSAQPTGPNQTCTVDGGSGTVNNADVANVKVSCGPGGTAPGTTSAGCMIPVPGFSGDYRISSKPSATYRIATTGSASAPLVTFTLTSDGITTVSATPYQVASTQNGGKRLTWNSTRTETTGPDLRVVVDQAASQALNLPMQPGETQSINAAVSGTVTGTVPGYTCTGTLSGAQQAAYTFVGVESVTVPAGTFAACRFNFERTANVQSTCGAGFGAGASTDRATVWTVDGLGLVKNLNSVDGSATELISRSASVSSKNGEAVR